MNPDIMEKVDLTFIKKSFVSVKNRNLKYSEKCGRNNGDDNAPSACH